MARQDPLRKFRFRLEIDGLQQAAFSEVSIGDLANDPIEYREGDEPTTVRKLSGLTKYANVTLKWGITDSTELAAWHQQIVGGATALEEIRKTVVIRVQDEAGADRAAFEITRAWPCKYDPTDLNATGNEVAIDSLELCNEGIRRIQ
ncbi:phage tail protein [Couchioplanes caeruleus]|uniref:Phage tail protein n=2 Tax=Couchioplanes caeruleus TaxID=56438 RepID=A0A1K0GSL3_9ACTN|nr:phage tail protein [Couchioplanes caeruleus]OJF14204.1 phage tail protein [Couchioplanes caeruleus subsp. caeruleus]ROP28330.1 phage tail-like protein [Couchioplanes caeruleus]